MKFEKFKPENYKNVDIKFTLRLPEELHQEISIYSNKHNISMNTLILNCIEYAMTNREDNWFLYEYLKKIWHILKNVVYYI